MRNYISGGESVDLTAPAGGVVSGTCYLIGALLVVAAATVAVGLPFAGYTHGVYDMPSDTGAAWAEGDIVYWDNTNKRFTKTVGSNTKAGIVVAAKIAGATTGRIRLQPVF